MMTCREVAEQLGDYLARELSPLRRTEVQAHLEHCTCCSSLVDSYCATIALTRQLPSTPLPEPFAARLRTLLSGTEAPRDC